MNKIFIIYLKEMKEVLRDRRTLMVMILLPMVILPLIFSGLIKFVQKQESKARSEVLKVAILNADALPALAQSFNQENLYELVDFEGSEADLKPAIQNGDIKLGLVFPEEAAELAEANQQLEITVYYNNASLTSRVIPRTQDLIDGYNDNIRTTRLKDVGFASSLERASLIEPARLVKIGVADMREILGERVGGFLPYIFIVFCFVGALYPAIDIGAGEKERGTLETLLLTPVPRSALVIAKFLVVFTSGIATAMLCLVSMGGWIAIEGREVAGELGKIISAISPVDLAMIGLMLFPLTAIFASLLLCLSIYAKNFKEAQSLIAPLNILAILPAVIAMLPGVELTVKWAMVPVTNIALAIKELAKGTVDYTMVSVIFGSTAVLAAVSIAVCVRWFQKESVLFRN